jgi:glyoxylase-like metal-dependent hydrolase (beta-lactamase superfamily II)
MIVKTFPVGSFQSNCSLVIDDLAKQALVIDPGGDLIKIRTTLQQENLRLTDILITHAHIDHVGAAVDLKEATGARLWLHENDIQLWENMRAQFVMLGLPAIKTAPVDQIMTDSMPLPMADGRVLHTPGHSPGSCCFYFPSEKLLFSGDTLFYRSVGRTDLWGGDLDALKHSLIEKLYLLPDDIRVITGHGPETVLGQEKKHNEFIRSREF